MANNTVTLDNTPIDITYKNDVITITGECIKASVSLTGGELRKLYWGKLGKGKIKAAITYKT